MKKIKNNLLTTTSLNIFTYLIPLVVTPYFLRIAGTENFALISIAQSIIQYLTLFVGFNLDATVAGDVAVLKNDKEKLQQLFWRTTYARLLLFLAASIVYAGIALVFLWNGDDLLLLNFTYLGLVGYAITPLWFYQGTEKFVQLFLGVAIGKAFFALIVFTWIKQSGDFWYYTLGLSLSQIITGALLFFYAVFSFRLTPAPFHTREIVTFLQSKLLLFKGGTMVNFCMNINVTLLGLLLSLKDFGLYMAANKLILVVFSLVTLPLNQSLYPAISRAISENVELALNKIRHLVVPGVTYVTLGICAGLFLFSKLVVLLMLGPKFAEAELPFRLMLFSLIANVISNAITLQLFIKLNLFKSYAKITQTSALLSVLVTAVFAYLFGLNGAALSWLMSEFFLLSYSVVRLRSEGILLFQVKNLNPKAVFFYWNNYKNISIKPNLN